MPIQTKNRIKKDGTQGTVNFILLEEAYIQERERLD
jgi:hypothetical protein